MNNQRIGWLDSCRAIAVMAVMLLHLTNPVTAHYPHRDFFLYVSRFGFLGVELFFMISGFVICYTLEHTAGFWAFQVNRFSRLFPAMLICSLITLVVACRLDRPAQFPGAHNAWNLLPGITFVNPQLWSVATGRAFHWINGSYWTLWVEVQFYLLASVIFYSNRPLFFRNLLLAGIALSCLKYLPGCFLNYHPAPLVRWGLSGFVHAWSHVGELFNLCFFIGWFLLGALFYRLYKAGRAKQLTLVFLVVIACLAGDAITYFKTMIAPLCIGGALFCGLFCWMIRRRQPLAVPGGALFRRIGMISYGMYLIHEEVGLLLINHFYHLLGSLSFLAPLAVIILLTGFAGLSYSLYQRPLTKLIRQWLNGSAKA